MAENTDRELERQSRRFARPSRPFVAVAAVLAVAGIILLIVGGGLVWLLGIVLIALAGPPAIVGVALLCAAAVSRWAARDRPFA
jgi:uncharacterized membrane protein YdbT with pleckstrin-like domain